MDHQSSDSQIARYIGLIFDTFLELRGDRKSGDDRNIIGGLARLDGYETVVIGYQQCKPVETPNVFRPEGYRKCSRLVRLAEAFKKPVIILTDIREVYTLAVSEQQQVNAALSLNLEEMCSLMTPIICVITDEYGGMAANTCAADRFLMMKDDSCSSPSLGETSTKTVGDGLAYIKAQHLLELGIIHRAVDKSGDRESVSHMMRKAILEELDVLTQVHPEVLVQQRLNRLQYQFLDLRGSQLLSGNLDETLEN